jgi:hypothetical protein
MMVEYHVLSGGLMRCCLETLHEAMKVAEVMPKEGDRLHCKYCKPGDTGGMIFKSGFWQWDQADVLDAVFAANAIRQRARHDG